MYTIHGYCLRTRSFSMQHCTKIKSVRKVEIRLCPKIFPSENFLLYSILLIHGVPGAKGGTVSTVVTVPCPTHLLNPMVVWLNLLV